MDFVFYLAAFDSTSYALNFEKRMQEAGLIIDIIPMPREITAN